MLRLALKVAAREHDRVLTVAAAVPPFAKLLAGASRAADEDPDEFLCSSCGKWCSTMGGLFQHRRLVHFDGGHAAHVKCCVVGSRCPCCHNDYRTRPRLLRHLVHGSANCVRASQYLEPLPPEVARAADEADRISKAARRKRGLRDSAGLPVIRSMAVAVPAA